MALADDFAEALGELEDQIPQSFQWPVDTSNPPTDYPCFASGFKKGGTLQVGGWAIDQGGVIIVRSALFAMTRPDRGQTVALNGIRYRLSDVLPAPGGTFLKLTCVNDSRGS